MEIAPCRAYQGEKVAQGLVEMADRKSVFKVYYLSIVGPGNPESLQWAHSGRSPAEFERVLQATGLEGVGFVTAFPHITKVFRFSPARETVLDVREFRTDGFVPIVCGAPDGFHEFACYGEAVIAAAEYHAWAQANSVAEYLDFRAPGTRFPVVNHAKLAAFWTASAREGRGPS